jgi:hypothetical protein
VTDWLQVSGSLYALPANSGDEAGSYLWLEAGERAEAVVAELFLPAVHPERLDAAMGVATGSVQIGPEQRLGDVQLQFGRVRGDRGVLSADGRVLVADVSFALYHHHPAGGFCQRCGGSMVVDPVEVIMPPDGGLMASPVARCEACAEV